MFRLFKKKYAYPEVKCPRNAREMTDEEMLLVNGGCERRENSHEGVANANVGDTIERKDGTVVTLNQGDIDYAKAQLGISDSGSGTSVSGSVGGSGSNGSGSGSSGSGSGSGADSGGGRDNALNFSGTLCKQENDGYPSYIDPKDKTITANIYSKKGVEQAFAAYTVLYDRGYSFRLTDGSQIIHTFTGKENVEKYVRSLNAKESKPNNTNISYSSTNNYSSNESDSDKRYNAVNSKNGHLMTINIKDKKNFGDYADYYLTVGKYGAAGTPVYDGIGLVNDKGQIVCILNDEKSVSTHYRRLNPKEIDNTAEAFFHYFNNDGNPVVLGDKVFQDIQYVNAESSHYNNIITGVTEESNGSYGVDMVKEGCPSLFRDFFVGQTRIDYRITTYDKYSVVQFTASAGDGFWDPNYLSRSSDDGIGPNKEFAGGTVYPFMSRTWTETMPNPSVMNWIK